MNIPGFCAEASLESLNRKAEWSCTERSNAAQTDVSAVTPAFSRSCLEARMECEEDGNNLWIPDSRLPCRGFCAYW
jgi:hypothetical protein